MNLLEDIVLEARGISKSFPGVRALDDVSVALRRGRVTALLGENGAGKSTLMNILAGVFPPDAGEIVLEGRRVRFASPHDASVSGMGIVFQELTVLPNLTVAENIFLGREPRTRWGLVDYNAMHEETRRMIARVGLNVTPDTSVGALRVGQQQLVEIARAMHGDARVLILDEPTSALSEQEAATLFALVRELKRQDVAIVFITHKLEELAEICDDVVVMRDGCVVGAGTLRSLSFDEIVRLMVGREHGELYRKAAVAPGAEVLRVADLSLRRDDAREAFVLRDVSFGVRSGEVVGIFGLMGAGRTELLEAIYGVHARRTKGDVFVAGERVVIRSPADAIACGLALAPEDRKHDGLVLEMSVQENAALACLNRVERFGLLNDAREAAQVVPLLQRFRVKTPSWRSAVRQLSGGNQQKVILAKWLATNPKVILLDEPTRGIDINAKSEIYALIEELAGRGLGVVLVSSELPEVLALSDRVLVLCEGRLTAEFARDAATPEAVLHAALPGTGVAT